ncbi:NUDIX domain-containing protein [Streptomyces triticirhizae]|uniref:NUDIX domain-containing protein n=1 Tax=Streptomyces triticirhizae TaxID=2483353 RepID=A0A3M2M598_9ACTN|nr:NUDIX domain-containing protein [Streptomyces triticirhizae]RMI43993.1 NUDIX domain-containing protein [Streptomyces triticirhizae]
MSQTLPPAVQSMTLLAAAVLVHDRATNRVLLLRRGPRAKFAPGQWDLPVGKCDPGEPVATAAVRELREETGLVVEESSLRVAHVLHAARGVGAPNGFLTVIFLTDTWRGEARNVEPDKHSEVRWVDVNALPENVVFGSDRVIDRCLADEVGLTQLGWA